MKLSKISGSIEDIVASPALLKLTGLLFQILFISHLIACLWFFMGDENNGWYSSGKLFGYKSESGDYYISSLYWAFTNLTTVGYGGITPKTTTERATAILSEILGTTVFGYVVSSIVNLSGTYVGTHLVLDRNDYFSRHTH